MVDGLEGLLHHFTAALWLGFMEGYEGATGNDFLDVPKESWDSEEDRMSWREGSKGVLIIAKNKQDGTGYFVLIRLAGFQKSELIILQSMLAHLRQEIETECKGEHLLLGEPSKPEMGFRRIEIQKSQSGIYPKPELTATT